MRCIATRPLRLLLLAALLAGAQLLALPAQAQEKIVSKQDFIDTLGGSEPVQTPPPVMRMRGPAGVKASGDQPVPAPAPKEIAISIHFKYDSTDLADEFSRRQLREAGEAFSAKELRAMRFEIGGHTDGQGSDAYNLDLSKRRAQAVKDALCRGHKVDCSRFQVQGYGKSQPVAGNDDEAGRAQNRRVVFKRLE